jgi:hypothetical protein
MKTMKLLNITDSLVHTPLLQIQSLASVVLQVLSWNLSGGTEESRELGYDGSVGTMTSCWESGAGSAETVTLGWSRISC